MATARLVPRCSVCRGIAFLALKDRRGEAERVYCGRCAESALAGQEIVILGGAVLRRHLRRAAHSPLAKPPSPEPPRAWLRSRDHCIPMP